MISSENVLPEKSDSYDAAYYETFKQLSHRAALKVLRQVRERYEFSSVVDFGCGAGAWLSAARKIIEEAGGTPDLLGIDGDYVKPIVDPTIADYIFTDLERPTRLNRRFDLTVCVEVAEHLPRGRSVSLIDDLCDASDVVFFSAAIPGQGGTHHINEQWQDFWHAIFSDRGYVAVDLTRQRFWSDPDFDQCPYYVANSFLYVEKTHPVVASGEGIVPKGHWMLRVAHPSLFQSNHFDAASLTKTLQAIPIKLAAAVSRRLGSRS